MPRLSKTAPTAVIIPNIRIILPFCRMIHKIGLAFFLSIIYTTCCAQVEDNYRSLLKDATVEIDKTNLPIVFINVDGQMILREDYILAQMKIIHNGDGEYNYGDTIGHPDQKVDYEGYIALKYRGHSSFEQSDKKPFAFRTLKTSQLPSEGGEKKKVSLLGMNKDNKWTFLAPWTDRSMIRDVLSFSLAKPWMDFVPDTRYCEVIIDGTYYGVFILVERVSQGKKRLNLKDSNEIGNGTETDILVYIDRGDDPYFKSKYHPFGKEGMNLDRFIKYEYKFPEETDFPNLPEGTKDFIDNEINLLEESFLVENRNTAKGYKNMIDVTSFVDYMLSTEVSNNVDGYRLSTYLYKHSKSRGETENLDSRWKCSLWDFNMAWGNTMYYNHVSNDLWHYDINCRDDFEKDNDWVPFYWHVLLQDPDYVELMCNRWSQYRSSNYSNDSIINKVDSICYLLEIGGGLDRNEKAWQIFTSSVWGVGYNVDNYQEEIEFLKNWILGRLDFLDKELSVVNTRIRQISDVESHVSAIYNLQGAKLSKEPEKGLFVILKNGKVLKNIK